MTPLKKRITKQQEINIRKHVDFLCFDPMVTDKMFDMDDYGRPQCGTPACSAGWMQVSFNDYGEEPDTIYYFGIRILSKEWSWCFRTDWVNVDNTAIGAAARLLYMLEYGIPKNWGDIMDGRAPYPDKILFWMVKVKAMRKEYFKSLNK